MRIRRGGRYAAVHPVAHLQRDAAFQLAMRRSGPSRRSIGSSARISSTPCCWNRARAQAVEVARLVGRATAGRCRLRKCEPPGSAASRTRPPATPARRRRGHAAGPSRAGAREPRSRPRRRQTSGRRRPSPRRPRPPRVPRCCGAPRRPRARARGSARSAPARRRAPARRARRGSPRRAGSCPPAPRSSRPTGRR